MSNQKYRQWLDGQSGVPERVPTDSELDAWPTPDTADGYSRRGLRFAQLGFPDRAVRDFEEAVALEPENAEYHYNLGTASLSLGLFEQALRSFDRAIELKPGNADAYGNRAVAFAALGDAVSMRKEIQQAVALGADRGRLEAIARYVGARRKMGHGLLNPGDDEQHDHGHKLPHPRWGGFPQAPR